MSNSTNEIEDFEKVDNINVKDIWYQLLSNWKLLLAILVIALTSSYFYLRYQVPLYEAYATIVIKDEQKTTSGMTETSAFEDLQSLKFNNSI
ncbi:MAG: hypothetical protein EBU01_16500, partial [Crocinitomicaceae bacterium]|nr:hypothetical protein [Crocinitomicaceae bacterium]